MTIFLIRHAQSQFNEVFVRDQPNPMIYDAPLSELGHRQGVATQIRVSQLDIRHVIVSPLTRTLQTTALLIGATRPVEVNAGVREQLKTAVMLVVHPAICLWTIPIWILITWKISGGMKVIRIPADLQ